MRIDWSKLWPPLWLAQPLVNPHQSAAVMVNAQADAQRDVADSQGWLKRISKLDAA